MASSVLSKMKRALSSDTSTEDYLSSIYSSLRREINSGAKVRDNTHALKLQAFLRQIKYMQRNQKNNTANLDAFPFASFWSHAEQLALMQKLSEITDANGMNLFQHMNFINTPKESYQLGAQLEIGVAKVVKSMESIATGKSYSQSQKSIVGGAHTQVPDLVGMADDEIKGYFNEVYSKVQQELKKYNSSNNTDDVVAASYMHSVQGKIDNIGLRGDLEISASLTHMEEDIINALKNATFTDKNYISTSELKFGQTNPFRVFMTVAPRGGGNALGRFERMESCFQDHSEGIHTKAPTLFYRIRAIYELTGARMKYTGSSQEALGNNIMKMIVGKPAKYLIWNNPIGDIYVIPTANIVNNIIDVTDNILPANWRDAMYGPIIIPQQQLSNLS